MYKDEYNKTNYIHIYRYVFIRFEIIITVHVTYVCHKYIYSCDITYIINKKLYLNYFSIYKFIKFILVYINDKYD